MTSYEDVACGSGSDSRIKVRCLSCRADGFVGASGWQGQIRHGRRCDVAPLAVVAIPAGGAAGLNGPPVDPTSARFAACEVDPGAEPTAAQIERAAKEGNLRGLLDDDGVLAAVQRGQISVSDAMNQDF